MRNAVRRRTREVTTAQTEYGMTMLMLIGCLLVVMLFAGYMLQVTAGSVSTHLAHLGAIDGR